MTLASRTRRPAAAGSHRIRLVALVAFGLAALIASGCTRPEPPSADPAASTPDGTPSEDAISKLNIGTRLLEQLLPAEAARRFEEALALQPRWLPALVDLAIARMNILDPAM